MTAHIHGVFYSGQVFTLAIPVSVSVARHGDRVIIDVATSLVIPSILLFIQGYDDSAPGGPRNLRGVVGGAWVFRVVQGAAYLCTVAFGTGVI